jgi:hypothetical protein
VIGEADPGIERDLVRLARLTTVEQVSQAIKDGTSLRRRRPGRWGADWTAAQVRASFLAKAERIALDVGARPPRRPQLLPCW